jgi:SAM-dependent methyltransferase
MAKAFYPASFFEEMQAESSSSARAIVPVVLSLVNPTSVVDVGCGRGWWLQAFSEAGLRDIQGLDGDWVDEDALLIERSRFKKVDLEKPLPLDRTFELAVCLEVAEHLPPVFADTLVESLTRLAPVVLFSAAVPLQGGEHHVNEQWPQYWVEKFARLGYVPVDALRRHIWNDSRVAFFYAQNMFFLVKRSEISNYPKLEEEIRMGHDSVLPLVHPFMYLHFGERWRVVMSLFNKLPPSVTGGVKRLYARLRPA